MKLKAALLEGMNPQSFGLPLRFGRSLATWPTADKGAFSEWPGLPHSHWRGQHRDDRNPRKEVDTCVVVAPTPKSLALKSHLSGTDWFRVHGK